MTMIIFSFRSALKYGFILEKSFQDSLKKEYRRYFSILGRGFIPGCICLVIALSVLFLASCGGNSGGPRELKLSLILGDTSDWYRGAVRFAELIEQRSGGAYRIKIYPHAQLAGQVQRTELEMVQSGVIDMSLESSILLSLIEKRMGVFSLPWLFDDYEEANRVLDGPLGQELLDTLPEKGLVGLAYGANGFRQVTNSRNPIRTPGDIAAMKIRVPGIRMYIDIFKLLGADPSSMNFGERGIVADGEPAILDSLRAKGMEIDVPTAEAIRSFREMVEPVYADYDRETGGGLVGRFREAAE